MAVVFRVWAADGSYVAEYPRQKQAAEHAARIGGTWTRQRY
jgi:hypothetical protein